MMAEEELLYRIYVDALLKGVVVQLTGHRHDKKRRADWPGGQDDMWQRRVRADIFESRLVLKCIPRLMFCERCTQCELDWSRRDDVWSAGQ